MAGCGGGTNALNEGDNLDAADAKARARTELDGTIEGGKWIACSYGGNNEIILARRIDDNTKECSVEYRREKGDAYVLMVNCKW